MTALVGSHRDRMSIFLNGAIHHFFHTAIMPKMNNFHPG